MKEFNYATTLIIIYCISTITRGYVITTPSKWALGESNQVCVQLSSPATSNDSLDVFIRKDDSNLVYQKSLIIPTGRTNICNEVQLENIKISKGDLIVNGTVGGKSLEHRKAIKFVQEFVKTFIQTDKYLYKPSQKVQFRILTLNGPFLRVSTTQYEEIWVENPSRTRIIQWLNVTNDKGLIHMSFDLSDEPEQGVYNIKVKLRGQKSISAEFKVEEYVLPRYEVILNPPDYVLGTTEHFDIEVCAKYTFGQPVKGNLTLILDNGGWGKYISTVRKNDKISGSKSLTIYSEEIGINNRSYFAHTINAKAVITESGTGIEMKSKEISFRVERTAIEFENLRPNEFVKPGLPYIGEVQVKFRDGSPAAYEPIRVRAENHIKEYTTNSKGILKFAHYPYENIKGYEITAINYPQIRDPNSWRRIMYESEKFIAVQNYFSPSSSSLAIALESDILQCIPSSKSIEIQLPVSFSTTDQVSADITVQVISRGQIQFTKLFTQSLKDRNPLYLKEDLYLQNITEQRSSNLEGSFIVSLTLPKTISPEANIIIWYTRDDGEVVADARNLDVTKCLLNDVNLSWSSDIANPGDSVTLSLKAEPSSLCSLGVVDKSVHLLSSKKKPLTIDTVLDNLRELSVSNSATPRSKICKWPKIRMRRSINFDLPNTRWPLSYWRLPSSNIDAFAMFNKAGLFVLTNNTVETKPCPEFHGYPFSFYNGGSTLRTVSLKNNEGLQPQHTPSVQLVYDGIAMQTEETIPTKSDENDNRTYFPETWLWNIQFIEESGINESPLTLPDTVTEWVGSAVCVHPTKGLGISSPASVTTFRDFFVELTLPSSVKRGEIFPVKISVFNYLEGPLPIRVVLEKSDAYDIIEESFSKQLAGNREGCVPAQDKTVFTVKIRPLDFGMINITTSASVDINQVIKCGNTVTIKERSDIIVKPVEVKIEGFVEEKVFSEYICSTDFKNEAGELKWTLEPPSGIIPNSARGFVSVAGDLMGPTLENLGHLVRMPYGCGEQNMLNFAPNIYVMQYLEAFKDDNETNEIATKAIQFMEKGYQRELTYRHDDGSYSAFGKGDTSGSTWLTAFVLKCFAQARDFISIDKDDLTLSKNWLKKKQLENGCFESVGKIIHKGMKGGLSQSESPTLLSSFVLISLLEAGESSSSKVVKEALTCLKADKEVDDPYSLAVRAYAYSLAGSSEAEETVQSLFSTSTRTTDTLYWKATKTQKSSRAIQVETAGYTVLTLLTLSSQKPELDYSQEIKSMVKWINNQRNGQGGFVSTQDTIVALQSLAEFEKITYRGSPDLTILANEGNSLFLVNENNKLLQQRATLNTIPTNVTFDIAGIGCTLIQAVLRYNLPDLEQKQAFNLSVEAENGNTCKTKRITACASYLLEDKVSNMAIIEVDLVSGYIPHKADLKKIVKENIQEIKRYEVDSSLVTFYIDEFSQEETCVSFRIKKEVEVENAKPGSVKVYDYYSPEYFVTQTYTIPNQKCSTKVEV